jgi:hypothetical protein
MTQTDEGLPFTDALIEISTDGSVWTDISGFAGSVSRGGGQRNTGEAYTADGDTAIVKGGKRQPVDVSVIIVYTEETTPPYDTVRAAYEAGSDMYVRWSPNGGDSGDEQYTTDAGIVTDCPEPVGSVESGDPLVIQFTVRTPKVTKSTVT